MITIGIQHGGPKSRNVSTLKKSLLELLHTHCNKTYCSAIDEFALMLRINGSIDDFGPEAVERIRRSKKKRNITADIVVPEERWQSLETPQLKQYLAGQIRSSLSICIARLHKDGDDIDDDQLLDDVDDAIAEFFAMDHPPNPNCVALCPNCGAPLKTALAKQCIECGNDWH